MPRAFSLFALTALVACGGSTTSSTEATSPGSTGGAAGAGGEAAGAGAKAGTGAAAGSGGGATAGGGGGATAGGGSGASAGTGGASAGIGGAAGAKSACTAFGAPDFLTLPNDGMFHQRRARLTSIAGDQVALVLGHDAIQSPLPPSVAISRVTFAPWGAWPASLPAPVTASATGGESFRIAPGTTGFALAFRDDGLSPPTPPQGLVFAGDVLDGQTMIASPTVLDASGSAPALWLAHQPGAGDPGFLVGWSEEVPVNSIHHRLHYRQLGGANAAGEALACGTEPLFGDAVRAGDGFLAAFSSSQPFGGCPTGMTLPPDGLPHRLQVARLDGGAWTLGDEQDTFGSILGIAMAPRADGGAWVTWLPTGDPAASPPYAARADGSGKLVGKPFALTTPGGDPAYAVGALGDALIAVTMDSLDPSAPTLHVSLHDDAGTVTETTLVPPDGHFLSPPFSVLGSPDGTALLVAWSDQPPAGTPPDTVHVARLTCVTP